MSATPTEQRNPYKGSPSRAWVRVRLTDKNATAHEFELLADTGSPCAIIISGSWFAKLKIRDAPDMNSNFGALEGGWLHIDMPELKLNQALVGYGSDAVAASASASSADFQGLAGLPLLRLLEYGGDANSFWLRQGSAPGMP